MGETQERERVLVHFSRRFCHCNPQTPSSEGQSPEGDGDDDDGGDKDGNDTLKRTIAQNDTMNNPILSDKAQFMTSVYTVYCLDSGYLLKSFHITAPAKIILAWRV